MKRGLFSKPDFEGALEYFSTAAKLYRSAGKEYTRQQVEAMKNAATCHRELDSHSLAGKMLEEAALALMLWRSPDMKVSASTPRRAPFAKRRCVLTKAGCPAAGR